MKPVYKRILLKLSGEVLAGEKGVGIDFDKVLEVCASVKECVDMGVEVAIVVGGGMFGVPGMVIGVPAFAVIYYLIESFVNYRVKKKNLPLENEFYDAKVVEKLKPEIADLREQIPLEEENTE